jgi:WD repeat-containing protein 45
MNARQPISDSLEPAVLNVQFCDESKCFTAALENGFDVYTTVDCEPRDGRRVENGISICSMLEGTRYFGLVGGGKRPKYEPDAVRPGMHIRVAAWKLMML